MLNKIKEFLNNSWGYLVAGISVIFGLVLFRKKVDHYANVVQKLDDSHQKQLRELKKAREEEQEKYEENERKHHERMAAVEKEYETSKKELIEKKRREVEIIVRNYGDQPDKLAQKLAEVTGFKIIMPQD